MKTPHPLPYFGSKKRAAKKIFGFFPDISDTFIEPFAGSLAMSLHAATRNHAKRYVVGDIHLSGVWDFIINKPDELISAYKTLYATHSGEEGFLQVRDRYNEFRDPTDLFFLICLSTHNAPRFTKSGDFSQSYSGRLRPKRPELLAKQVERASYLLRGRTEIRSSDWLETIADAERGDFIFLDPPYLSSPERVYGNRVTYEDICNGIETLIKKDIPFAVTYDGVRTYLPKHLNLTRLLLVGTSNLGSRVKKRDYSESLYLYPPQKDLEHQVVYLR